MSICVVRSNVCSKGLLHFDKISIKIKTKLNIYAITLSSYLEYLYLKIKQFIIIYIIKNIKIKHIYFYKTVNNFDSMSTL